MMEIQNGDYYPQENHTDEPRTDVYVQEIGQLSGGSPEYGNIRGKQIIIQYPVFIEAHGRQKHEQEEREEKRRLTEPDEEEGK